VFSCERQGTKSVLFLVKLLQSASSSLYRKLNYCLVMASPMRGKENLAVLSPLKLSPAPNVHQSPHGLAFDVLIKPPSAKKVLATRSSPSTTSNLNKKLEVVEKNREEMKKEEEEKKRQREEKLKSAKCNVLSSIENHQKQTLAKVIKKEETSEEMKLRKEKELEGKKVARMMRAEEAKKAVNESLEMKKYSVETALSKIKLAEELREANLQAKADKAKKDLIKVDNTVAAMKKKREELDENIKLDLQNKEATRLKLLSNVKETCGNHVKEAKNRAILLKEQKDDGCK